MNDDQLGTEPTLFDLPVGTLAAPSKPKRKKKNAFFSSQTPASAVKTQIVVSYFKPWSGIMKRRSSRLLYIDLYAGPGKYDDGTLSTPAQIIQVVLGDARLSAVTQTIFEDNDPKAADSLSETLAALPGFKSLSSTPHISSGETMRKQIVEVLASSSVVPTFMFLDPFGYAGLTRDLIRAIIKDWGCDVLFYFNFNRINAALRNPKVQPHMEALFGTERVENLRRSLAPQPSENDRERIITEAVREALIEIGAKHVLKFGFRKESGALDHHLIFATKNMEPAQRIMKDIMAGASSRIDQDGVASFEYDPRKDAPEDNMMQLPFRSGSLTPMNQLKKALLTKFRGRRLTVREIYEQHNDGTPYTIKNYQEALRRLAYDDKVVNVRNTKSEPLTATNIKKRNMSPDYVVKFSPKP